MSQSSLEKELQDAKIDVKRGVKVRPEAIGENMTKTASNIWLYRWAKNSYRNYPLVEKSKGVAYLLDSAKGMPAIVVGVGPSLDHSISAIKAAKGRAFIISTDAAFRALLANGIKPDIVISYDCKPEQKLLWADIHPHDVPILFDTCAHPDAIASWTGPVLFYNHFHQADQLSELILGHVNSHIGQIPSGGTVGNVALLLTKALGCSPAIAVGMDFCYAQEGAQWKYRARDYKWNQETGEWTPDEVKLIYDNSERLGRSYLKDFKGQTYRMDPELAWYHDIIIGFISHFKIETINTSPAGALKDVVATMPIEAAIERFCLAEAPAITFHKLIADIGVNQ